MLSYARGGKNTQNNDSFADDHTYISIDIPFDETRDGGTNSSIARFQTTKTQVIVNNPSEHHLAIDRFDIPGFLIPSYIFDPLNKGEVGLKYLGVDYFVNLNYVPNSFLPASDPTYYYIYDYQHWADLVNTALAAAFALIPVPPVGSNPPKLVWNSDTQRFSVYAEAAFYDAALANPIYIYFDYEVYRQIPFMDYYFETYSLVRLNMKNNLTNTETIAGTAYLYLEQQASGVSYWNAAKGLVFTSNGIPVKNTFTQLNNKLQDDSNASSLGILIDFKLNIANSLDQRKGLIYVPQQNYRRLDLFGTAPLKQIDISIYWTDINGNLNPLRIPRGEQCNIKLLFIRKSYIDN